MVTIDNLRAAFTYVIALIVLLGGGAFLFATRLDVAPDDLVRGAFIGFMGSAITFVFGQETATRAARQAAASTLAATTAANGHNAPPLT